MALIVYCSGSVLFCSTILLCLSIPSPRTWPSAVGVERSRGRLSAALPLRSGTPTAEVLRIFRRLGSSC